MRTLRRAALTAALLALWIPTITRATEPGDDALRAGFVDPPATARVSTYWLWLNGYLDRDHVEAELSAFHEAGIRGVCIFDMGARGDESAAPPAGPPFMGEHSVADIAHAVRVAGKLGIDVQLSVASSWDMGGSWVRPEHASMGLFSSSTQVEGPGAIDLALPMPPIPGAAPRDEQGRPLFLEEVALVALPAEERLPGFDFVFALDPPGEHALDHAVIHRAGATPSGDDDATIDFAISVSSTKPIDEAFREIARAKIAPSEPKVHVDLPPASARYVRLRIFPSESPRGDQVALGEFEVLNDAGLNVVASHVADRARDGAQLLGVTPAWGHDRTWTAANIHDGAKSGAHGSWASPTALPLGVSSLDDIIDLSGRIGEDGKLRWDVPAGKWLLLRYVCANTGERLKVPSPNSDGLATDHFSREATRSFLQYEIDALRSALGDLGDTALEQLYLASYEVRGSVWTPDFLAQFRNYRGYDMTPFLPALSGNLLADDETTRRFLYDFRKTQGDLLVDAYYRAAVDTAHAAGLGIESEAGGPGPPIHQVPVDALKALGAIDEIRGEFWPKRPDADRLWVVKETACAGHIYGKRRIHMEAFTSMHHWQDGPLDLKPSADRAFCEGANHMVWHTASHLPPSAGYPGWVYGAGTHLNTQLIWWPQARAFLDYLGRCSFLLQQGRFVGDVVYYYGDQGYNFVPPKHVDPSLGFGYDYDVINAEVLCDRAEVEGDRVVLPSGMRYAILVLPDREDIDLAVLRKVAALVRRGATVVGPRPRRATGLHEHKRRDAEVRRLGQEVWGPCDGETVFEHRYGQGRVVWGRPLRAILIERGLGPDFSFSSASDQTQLDFIHRRLDQAEIYFVRNMRPTDERVRATFRVPDGMAPEAWDPATGQTHPIDVFARDDAGVTIPLHFAPDGSTFIVFRPCESHRQGLTLAAPAPDSDLPDPLVVRHGDEVRLLAFQNGVYRVRGDVGGTCDVAEVPSPMTLDSAWSVTFTSPVAATRTLTLDELAPWNEHPDPEIRYFSGQAAYRQNVQIPQSWVAGDRRVWLDLGGAWAIADVVVNGRRAGAVWKPPYRIDVTDLVTAGDNTIEIAVYNTWSNRLVGDAQLPAEQRKTTTNVRHTGGSSWKNAPLIDSGLFGPVRLLLGVEKIISGDAAVRPAGAARGALHPSQPPIVRID